MNYLNGGYVMIKHNATQKDLAAAYKSNRPVLVYDENQKAHWAQINETIDDKVVTTYTYSYQLINDVASLIDSAGNSRFIEGEGVLEEITGVTYTYNKWSLSGTHLMIVLAGTIADTTAITAGEYVTLNLPSYILDKIYVVFSNVVNRQTVTLWASDYSSQTFSMQLQKYTNNLKIYFGGVTLTKERNFRVQFDLLIDNDYGE